ncbi:MAG TPA: helix-turn-helix domain-containing protein [Ferrovibrio sp.]|uniref:TetR/AcrR family transcriptional regulator n=1 Tax=Ferrovibrio sp. TaxID=1917215 RepID=UPI002ED147D6
MPADAKIAEAAGRRQGRRAAIKAFKREAILKAARSVFARDGLDGATLRAIAAEAGVAVGTVYLHYPGKEALYADMLAGSLADLLKHLREAVAGLAPEDRRGRRLMAAALAFYDFYRSRADDLYLGLYLAQGLKPVGLTPELDRLLNGRLIQCYSVLGDGLRQVAPLAADELRMEIVSLAAGITGALVLEATGRLKMLGDTGEAVVRRQVETLIARRAGGG